MALLLVEMTVQATGKTKAFTGKPFKDKNPEAFIIHPLNEMTEVVHEQRSISSQNSEMNVDKKIIQAFTTCVFHSEEGLVGLQFTATINDFTATWNIPAATWTVPAATSPKAAATSQIPAVASPSSVGSPRGLLLL